MAFRYRKFRVYNEAKTFHLELLKIINRFPRDYFYLADQLKRSSLSIVLNIAEGSSKQSDKDFNRFIAMSLGSIDETDYGEFGDCPRLKTDKSKPIQKPRN